MNELKFMGERLRAFRLGAGLSADDLADRLHVSRATLYRYEQQGVSRIEIVRRIAKLLDISIVSLLGAEVEYIKSSIVYFERLRQIEAVSDWSFVAFGPISYLLTSAEYDIVLRSALLDLIPASEPNQQAARETVRKLMRILAQRKMLFSQRVPRITNLLSLNDIREFLQWGLSGPFDYRSGHLSFKEAAVREVERITNMLDRPPMGIQIGILPESLPSTSFNLLRCGTHKTVALSPFRLGARPNIRQGIATITSATDGVKLYETFAEELWSHAITGRDAAELVAKEIENTAKPI